ncbi:hypothetical protein AB0J81_09195 [Streptomyces bobili]|uniref:hypothetical protein n=1 Tax=Streptomyces bobili TaxID=67280 RepID=UPI00341F4129
MSETVTLSRATRALEGLGRAFQLGRSVDQPGIITSSHTTTWHMAGMIEHLHTLRADQAEQLRRGELDVSPVRPDEEPT